MEIDTLHDIIREQERIIEDKSQQVAEKNLIIAQLQDKINGLTNRVHKLEQAYGHYKKCCERAHIETRPFMLKKEVRG